MGFLFVVVQLLVTVVWLLVVGRVVLSWINPTFNGPAARFMFDTTEPMLAPIRRVLPATGTFDLSALVLLLLLGVLVRLLVFR